MNLRASHENDKPQIIKLLKESLGEGLLKKSQHIWDFKHGANPFGKSYIILAEENNKLTGVRAFMSWKWQIGETLWQSYRAVDTATHPDYQGKGIFTKLTRKAMDAVGAISPCFIFNTPNEKSRPGYLKMGWKIVAALPLSIVPVPLFWFSSLFGKKVKNTGITEAELALLCEKHNAELIKTNRLFTPKSPEYLSWRYRHNPLQEYMVFFDADWYVAMYCKKHSYFTELRVVEAIYKDQKALKTVKSLIIQKAIANKCLIITLADKKMFTFQLYGKFGPKLTFNLLANDPEFESTALDIRNWEYSLGDLELF
ncbi:GNAT family N-acetyltransferase [Flavobacterium enshiense]|uniref:GNAT family N-acetyltransferase n=1 Tax=Flavobacterium enshiense TaxID=1341165 RepID=UPI00345DC9D7